MYAQLVGKVGCWAGLHRLYFCKINCKFGGKKSPCWIDSLRHSSNCDRMLFLLTPNDFYRFQTQGHESSVLTVLTSKPWLLRSTKRFLNNSINSTYVLHQTFNKYSKSDHWNHCQTSKSNWNAWESEIDTLDRFAYIEGKYDMNHHNDTRFIIFSSK